MANKIYKLPYKHNRIFTLHLTVNLRFKPFVWLLCEQLNLRITKQERQTEPLFMLLYPAKSSFLAGEGKVKTIK